MALYTSLSALSQTPSSNAPDGTVDAPSTVDDQLRLLGSFIALLRDGKAGVAEQNLASASTCDIGGVNSPLVRITGTTAITSFGSNYTGPRFLRFAGALTLTHNATTLILPGGADITTAAGDTCIAIPLAAGWYVLAYSRAALPAWSYGQSVSQTLTSGAATKITFTSSDFDATAGAYASSRFTAAAPGYYQIDAGVYISATSLTAYNLYLYKNGSVWKRGATRTGLSGSAWADSMSALVYLSAGDYVEVYADGTGTGTISTNATASVTFFQGALIRAA